MVKLTLFGKRSVPFTSPAKLSTPNIAYQIGVVTEDGIQETGVEACYVDAPFSYTSGALYEYDNVKLYAGRGLLRLYVERIEIGAAHEDGLRSDWYESVDLGKTWQKLTRKRVGISRMKLVDELAAREPLR